MKKILYLLLCLSTAILTACTNDETPALAPKFSSTQNEITIGESIIFKDESSGEPSKWTWHFEGGTPETSVLFSPKITYNKPGKYMVSLEIGRGNTTESIVKEQYVIVNHPSEITVDFAASKTVATNEDLISFTDMSTGYPSEWLWEFTPKVGPKVTSTEQNPALKFDLGIYTVTLTATSPKATSSKTMNDLLSVIDKNSVAADFSAISRNTYAGGNIQFEDKTSGNATGWLWTFEGGIPATSTSQHPNIKYTTPGKYKVKLTSSNEVKNSTIEKETYVSVISAQELIFYYPFDGNNTDAGPNNLNPNVLTKGAGELVYNATTRFSGVNSECRSAAQFTNKDVNNYTVLSLPESNLLDFRNSDFTVSFWVKVGTVTKTTAVFHHGAGPGVREDKKSMQSWFRFANAQKNVVFCVEHTGFTGNWAEHTGERKDDDKWHHYVCIYKTNNGLKDSYLYIDGELTVSSLGKPMKSIEKSPYYIGCNYRITAGNFLPENFMNGSLDDYILYNRALTEQEVKELFNQ